MNTVQSAAELVAACQWILLDLDGTLVDSVPDLHHAMQQALALQQRPAVTLDQIRHWVGRGAADLCRSVLLSQDKAVDTAQHQQLLQDFLSRYQQQVCVASQLYPHAAECLAQLRQQGKHLACVTNKPYAPAQALLEQLGIAHYFAVVVGGDSLPQRKPAPEPLWHAIHQLRADPQQTVMIGDSAHDVSAARAAGIACIAVSYGYNHGEPIADSQPDVIIDDLAQLIRS